MILIPNNWAELQHYKDRSPPWIKLHKKLLDNYEYQCLPVASKALAPMLWLLASDHDRGEIDAAPKKLAFRLRMTEREVNEALRPLIDNGFFLEIGGASDVLAERERLAALETEKRREEKEKKAREFAEFWSAYPRKEAKKDAEAAWASVVAPLDVLLAAIALKLKSEDWQRSKGQFIPLPASWLRGKRWEDVGTTAPEAAASRHHDTAEATALMLADKSRGTAPPPAEIREQIAALTQRLTGKVSQ